MHNRCTLPLVLLGLLTILFSNANLGLAQSSKEVDEACFLLPRHLRDGIMNLPPAQRSIAVTRCRESLKAVQKNPIDPETPMMKRQYWLQLYSIIGKYWRQNSKQGNMEVKIQFELQPSGQLAQASIQSSSGNSQLDKQALEFLHKLQPFAPFQGKMSSNRRFILQIAGQNARLWRIEDIDHLDPAYDGNLSHDIQSMISAYLRNHPLQSSQGFLASLIVSVAQNGHINTIKVHHTSGNNTLDLALTQAISTSAPFVPFISQKERTLDFYIFLSGEPANPTTSSHTRASVYKLGITQPQNMEPIKIRGWWENKQAEEKDLIFKYLGHFWRPSQSTEAAKLRASFNFEVLPSGELKGLSLHQSSGAETFDREALSALRTAAPFKPYVPESILEGALKYRLYLGGNGEKALFIMQYPFPEDTLRYTSYNSCCDPGKYDYAIFALFRKHWGPPMYAHASPLYLRMTVDPNGNISKLVLENTSGFSELDKSAIEALQKAAPFPEYISMDGKSLEFPLELAYGTSHNPQMGGKTSWPTLAPSGRSKYFPVTALADGAEKPEQWVCTNLDSINSTSKGDLSVLKGQIQRALDKQIENHKREATVALPPNVKALLNNHGIPSHTPLGPGKVTVRFKVADNGYPVAVHTVKVIGNKVVPRQEWLLGGNAEGVILQSGPFKTINQSFEITLTYP